MNFIISGGLVIKLKFLFSLAAFAFVNAYSEPIPYLDNNAEFDRSEIFVPEKGKPPSLEGRIIEGRYHSPKSIFSCQAYDFGEAEYISQDVLLDCAACVAFYDSIANFKKAEVLFLPGMEDKNLRKKSLKGMFESFGIGILKDVDNAQGIEILEQEVIEENMLFTVVSIEKMSVLMSSDGHYMQSTRGYLIFPKKDKIVVLSNQKVTLPKECLTRLKIESQRG